MSCLPARRSCLCTMILLVHLCSEAGGQAIRVSAPDTGAFAVNATREIDLPGGYATGFEPPGFQPASLHNQGGWQTNTTGLTNLLVTPFHPFEGDQNVRMLDGGAGGLSSFAISPTFGPLTEGRVSFRYSVAGVTPGPGGGADYDFVAQSTASGIVLARVKFQFDGSILILDDFDNGIVFVNSNADWLADGQYHSFSIEFSKSRNTLRYFHDGELIYNGFDLFASQEADQFVIVHDNFQQPDETADVDAVTIVPEPTSWLLLSVCAALCRRRRVLSA